MTLSGDPKRQHHHVWQYYLAAWKSDGVVACRHAGRVFSTGTEVLAVKKNLHRIKDPSEAEIGFLVRVCFPKDMNPMLRELNRGWLPIFFGPPVLERLAAHLGCEDDDDIRRLLEIARSNTEEDLHAHIERDSIKHIDALRLENLSFLEDPDERGRFLHFLCLQDFRTRGKHESIARSVEGLLDIRVEKVVAPMTHIFVTNVAWGLFTRWETTRVTLLRSDGELNFITGDQPVLNVHAIAQGPDEPVDELTYFFPIGPRLALMWDVQAPENSISIEDVGRERVEEANRWVASAAWEQLYASDEATLHQV